MKLNQNNIDELINLIIVANKAVIEIYNTDFEYTNKKDLSPLTIADLEANKIICQGLNNLNKNLDENILIISEENKNLDFNQRKKYKYCWLVDPIDGTKEFIKRNGQFTTNIGLVEYDSYNDKYFSIFGIVGIPVEETIYYGGLNYGSYKTDYHNNRKQVNIKKIKEGDTLKIVASNSHMNKETKDFIKNLNQPYDLVNYGSSIKILKVADGSADLYPRIAPTMEWDTCAAHSIIKGAGGNLITYPEKNELVYNKENLLNPYFQTIN